MIIVRLLTSEPFWLVQHHQAYSGLGSRHCHGINFTRNRRVTSVNDYKQLYTLRRVVELCSCAVFSVAGASSRILHFPACISSPEHANHKHDRRGLGPSPPSPPIPPHSPPSPPPPPRGGNPPRPAQPPPPQSA